MVEFFRLHGGGRTGPRRRPPPVATGLDGATGLNGRFLSLDADSFKVALLIPMCGTAGLWAPSCIANAQLAVDEVNRDGGVLGRQAELVIVDSAIEAEAPLETLVDELIDDNAIDAIVGMHISAIRERLRHVVRARVPYIYTPLYEGGETAPGVFAIGDTPDRQLGPAIAWLHQKLRPKRWAFVGNDYVWPRASNDFARRAIAKLGGEVVYERYLPFGFKGAEEEARRLSESGADAVLMSLIGQDAVDFNRAFGRAALHDRMIRLSCAMEENGLLACGEESLRGLYASSSYFSALATASNLSFKERYFAMHGDRAPTLNALGQSAYEGVQFLAGLLESHPRDWAEGAGAPRRPIRHRSARKRSGRLGGAGDPASPPIYLARAKGVAFEILDRISEPAAPH